MARSVVWTRAARDDFDAAIEFIGRDSPAYASTFVLQIRDASRSLTTLAERGRVVPELGRSNVREIFIQRYRLVYRVKPDLVEITALIHGSRDFRSVWRRRRG